MGNSKLSCRGVPCVGRLAVQSTLSGGRARAFLLQKRVLSPFGLGAKLRESNGFRPLSRLPLSQRSSVFLRRRLVRRGVGDFHTPRLSLRVGPSTRGYEGSTQDHDSAHVGVRSCVFVGVGGACDGGDDRDARAKGPPRIAAAGPDLVVAVVPVALMRWKRLASIWRSSGVISLSDRGH